MKFALIGCGSFAHEAMIPALLAHPQAKISCFCDLHPERAQAAAEKYGCGSATDVREALSDPQISAAVLCTPASAVAPLAQEVMRAGKHVLCALPPVRLDEIAEMQRVSCETGRLLAVDLPGRCSDSAQMIRRYIESGKLGEVYHVSLSFRSFRAIPDLGGALTTKALSGGGVLMERGLQFLDIALFCCGDPQPRTVTGEIFCRLGRDIPAYTYHEMPSGPPHPDGVYDVEDSVAALIRTDGPVLSLHGAWAQNIDREEMYIDFMGDQAGIRLRFGENFTVFTSQNDSLIRYQPEYRAQDPHARVISEFIRSAQSGERSDTSAEAAASLLRISQAVYDSSAQHCEIKLTHENSQRR